MSSTLQHTPLCWVIPGLRAGMPMPFINPGRRLAGGAVLTALSNIKSADAMIVGMYQQLSDQVAENTAIVRDVWAGRASR